MRGRTMAEPEQSKRRERKNLIRMGVAALIASALGVVLSLVIDWFPRLAGTEGKKIDTLWDVLLVISVPIFVLVTTVVVYCVAAFRMRPGQELMDGPPLHGNTRLEVVWTAVPAVLLVSLCSYAYAVLADIEQKKPHRMVVQVMGEQFAWHYTYPKGPGGKPITTDVLTIPEHRQIEFQVQANDVLHDFWVPAFRLKTDAVPGITTHIRVTPKRLGQYPVVCAELCGLGHALMRSSVRVVPQSAFDSWLAKQKSTAPSRN
jgi:cytochrome c oxidase subunit 2